MRFIFRLIQDANLNKNSFKIASLLFKITEINIVFILFTQKIIY